MQTLFSRKKLEISIFFFYYYYLHVFIVYVSCLTQCYNILLCVFKRPIVGCVSESEIDLYVTISLFIISNIIHFPCFFPHISAHTKHLPQCRRIIFYSPSIVRNATKRLYECTYCVFSLRSPQFFKLYRCFTNV